MAQYKEDKGKRLTKMAEDKLKKEAEPPVTKKEGKEKPDDKTNSKLHVTRLLIFFMLNSTEHKISSAHKTKIWTNKEISCFKSLTCCIYHAKAKRKICLVSGYMSKIIRVGR